MESDVSESEDISEEITNERVKANLKTSFLFCFFLFLGWVGGGVFLF